MREATSFDRFEWDATAGISFPGAYGGTDFDNRGEKGIERQVERNRRLNLSRPPSVETTDSFLYLNAGLWGQLGGFGLAVTADLLRYEVKPQTEVNPPLSLSIVRFHAVAAYGFLHNQLCVGAGLRMAYVDVEEVGSSDKGSVISMFGVSPEAGLIVKPEDHPWRLGLTARLPVSATPFSDIASLIREERPDGTTIRRAGTEFILPRRIALPWEIEAGIAYQLGPRPLNPRWIDPREHEQAFVRAIEARRRQRREDQRTEIASMPGDSLPERGARAARLADIAREEADLRATEDAQIAEMHTRLQEERKARYANWPREHVLLLASVLMTGASAEAVALEGFIDQRRELVGAKVVVGPRFAVESEPIPNRLKTRAGVYFEPSRFSDGAIRQHFTVGLDVRLFGWNVFGLISERQWRLTSFLDIAERYQNFGFSVGTWY